MLQEEALPELETIAGNSEVWWLQDGAPAHWGTQVREYLDACFPETWIGRDGPIAWPARSPDINPLDYYLWGFVKHMVFQTPTRDLNELRQKITTVIQGIQASTLVKVREEFFLRMSACIQEGGRQFQHKMK